MSIVDVNGIKPFERNRQTLSSGDVAEAQLLMERINYDLQRQAAWAVSIISTAN